MNEIIPGVLEKEWSEIEKKLQHIATFSPRVHIDLLDGVFANNTTFLDPTPFAVWAKKLEIEVHMMVQNPILLVDFWGEIGVKRFLGHVEMMPDQKAFIEKAKQYGEAGLALDGKTPLDQITVSLADIDALLIMTIDAGFSGQVFNPLYAQKCTQAHGLAPDLRIEVDGGIHTDTLSLAKGAGASRFVATSALFSAEDAQSAYEELVAID